MRTSADSGAVIPNTSTYAGILTAGAIIALIAIRVLMERK